MTVYSLIQTVSLTLSIPVNMCDVTGCSLTCTNSLLTHHTVHIHKVVMGTNSQVLASVLDNKHGE